PACPLAIIAVVGESVAEAPAAGAVNEMMPPSTGSAGVTAVTVTAKGFANDLLTRVNCGGLPAGGPSANPWVLKAPGCTGPPRGWAGWAVVGVPLAVGGAAIAGLPGSSGIVGVDPPYLPNEPSSGLMGLEGLPSKLSAPSLVPLPSPIRLFLPKYVPSMSPSP